MIHSELHTKILALCEDEKFTAKIAKCSTPTDIAALFSAEGVSVSAKDIEALLSMTSKAGADELPEEALNNITGGSALLSRVGPILLPLLSKLPITVPVQPIKKVIM